MEQQINRSIEIFMPVIKTFLVNDSRLWNICEIIIAIFHLINWTLHLCKLLKDKYSGKFIIIILLLKDLCLILLSLRITFNTG